MHKRDKLLTKSSEKKPNFSPNFGQFGPHLSTHKLSAGLTYDSS